MKEIKSFYLQNNILTNDITNEENNISLELTNEEMDNYQKANIYIFRKNDDKYELLLKSDKGS